MARQRSPIPRSAYPPTLPSFDHISTCLNALRETLTLRKVIGLMHQPFNGRKQELTNY